MKYLKSKKGLFAQPHFISMKVFQAIDIWALLLRDHGIRQYHIVHYWQVLLLIEDLYM